MTSPEVEAEIQTAKALIANYVALFLQHGYHYEEMRIEKSDVGSDFAVFLFLNDSTGMQIEVNYSPPWGNRIRMLNATIINPRGSHMSVGGYLQHHKRTGLIKSLIAKAKSPDVPGYWDEFFAVLADLFDTELKDIIDGRRWEDVPIDWQGLK